MRSENEPGEAAPLDGVLVVDLSSGIAGGYCTKVLADAGAEVVKVEGRGGDFLRRWSASGSRPADEDGALFQFLSCSKRSVVLDPDDESDAAVLHTLLGAADAVVWTPDGALGGNAAYSPQMLAELAPTASVVTITPYGLDGPWADLVCAEATLQALSGGPAMRGDKSRPPILAGGRMGDWLAGMFAGFALLASRYRGLRTGVGEIVDVSALEALALTMTPYSFTFNELAGRPWRSVRMANLPDIHRTSDGYVGFMVVTGQQWLDFAAMVEHPEWADDASLGLMNNRSARRDELLPEIDRWTSSQTTAEVVELASLMRIPVAEVGDGKSIPELDHLVERDFYLRNPGGGFLQPDVPYRLGGGAGRVVPQPAPALGEHTDSYRARQLPARRIEADEDAATLPFEGLRVADFTAFWAGPIVGHCLAMLGADVIHVESTQRPDGMRYNSVKKLSEDQWWEWAPMFQAPNTNKRGLTLDMSSTDGLDLARKLIARSDVVVENYSPRVMESWGLDRDNLLALNPELLVLRMPAFGLTGQWRDRVGFAQTMEQISGLAYLTGYPDGHPITPNGPCDPIAGMHAAIALMLGLEHRRRTGAGMQIESIMLGGALNVAAEQVTEYSAYGRLLQRDGNRSPWAAPQGVYLAADNAHGDSAHGDSAHRGTAPRGAALGGAAPGGAAEDREAPADGDSDDGDRDTWVSIAIESDEQWCRFVAAVGSPDWATRDELRTVDGRRVAHDELDEHISAWCASRDADGIVGLLWPAGVPAARVLFAHEQDGLEQLHHRGFIETVEHPVTGPARHIGFPARFGNGPEHVHRRPPPTLGQHNADVLRDLLGVTGEEYEKLLAAGVIGSKPGKSGAW
jgi:crotonobetainyl-CoA:carnitine CoA-transferase CaiB-like acyl-CoA transferase